MSGLFPEDDSKEDEPAIPRPTDTPTCPRNPGSAIAFGSLRPAPRQNGLEIQNVLFVQCYVMLTNPLYIPWNPLKVGLPEN